MKKSKWTCIMKWVGIVIAIAGAAAAAYLFVSKQIAKKKAMEEADDYLSCVCFDDCPDEEATDESEAQD